ncbi:adenylate/guanylate cyclase domain-containing protein [Sneathiella limimaris]|uniref:adenylate/guanylate cyclase domain-containing protein n=1 Tax=Sneathiella limimaris TaxID=1964213 RepID=UPI00146B447B|nr:adenylate/guanylate cyclase domain-containing protein [Sneathiella limimaris]
MAGLSNGRSGAISSLEVQLCRISHSGLRADLIGYLSDVSHLTGGWKYMRVFKGREGIGSEIEQTLLGAEQQGLKLAIKGRLIALVVVGLWMVPSRGADRAADIILALVVLVALGLLHFFLIGSRWDRKWVKYVFITVDLALLSGAMALVPPEPGLDLPQIFIFRFDVFHYYYVIIAVAAFSFSPGLVLYSGVLGAIGWLSAFLWVRSGIEKPLEWGDALTEGSSDYFSKIILHPDFVATGSRVQEAIIYLMVALLVAVVMYRARLTVRRRFEAEQDVATVTNLFGRYVPEAVAQTMIEDKGALDPIERQATVMFVDVEGFTSLTEAKGPGATVDILNAYFDAATEIISRHGGIVTQFQGDGILAVFNVPIAVEDHVGHAYQAASELLALVESRDFAGTRFNIRIGLTTGPVFAGNIGGGGRQSYTVYGDTVNLASRLEVLNKTQGTRLLISHFAAAHLPSAVLRSLGAVEIRGVAEPVEIYTHKTDGEG